MSYHGRHTLRTALRQNGLLLCLAALFAISVAAMTLAGQRVHNDERREYGQPALSLVSYLSSGHFFESLFENWESEFLQMGAYVYLTIWLRQKGSSESKSLDGPEEVDEDPREHARDPDAPGPVRKGGLLLAIYEHSLGFAFLLLFIGSFVGHGLGGHVAFNEERLARGEPATSLVGYMTHAQFWFESFQNWQSEFLAVISIVGLSIFLRQRGSPESKPVAAPHSRTGK